MTPTVQRKLPELATLERILPTFEGLADVEVVARVRYRGIEFPIHAIVLGNREPEAPSLGIFGGVHGLERIGAEVVVAYLQTLSELLTWDELLRERLRRSRLVFMPIVNPVGIFSTSRANGNGIDLMRNSPTMADDPPPLLGGQRLSRKLPWFRGYVQDEQDMEVESRAMLEVTRKYLLPSKVSLAVDVHSGFGSIDRLWFPYSKTKRPPPHLAEIAAFKRQFDRSYPNHFYRIEPQAKQYTIHGDIWDYMYDESMRCYPKNHFMPWTLELGSWLWIKKNPRQIFSALGPFNPIAPHRLQRILRRHITLFDFMHRAVISPATWIDLNEDLRRQLVNKAMDLWYDDE